MAKPRRLRHEMYIYVIKFMCYIFRYMETWKHGKCTQASVVHNHVYGLWMWSYVEWSLTETFVNIFHIFVETKRVLLSYRIVAYSKRNTSIDIRCGDKINTQEGWFRSIRCKYLCKSNSIHLLLTHRRFIAITSILECNRFSSRF